MTCEEALDRIHAILDGTEWSADTLNAIAEVIVATGRVIRPPLDAEERR